MDLLTPAPFVAGEGDMAGMVREHDWASTPLGPIETWPVELKSTVSLVLGSHFPCAIVWGDDLVTIYNDGFRTILGQKPEALGRSFAEVWAEAWHEIGPIAERAFEGEATYIEDFPLEVNRNGKLEKAWFTFCYSPIRLADGSVAGMLDTVIETTSTVQTQSHLEILAGELGHRLKNTLAMVQSLASQTLGGISERAALDKFRQRIVALGTAHDVLIQRNWSAGSLEDLIRTTFQTLGLSDRIDHRGPNLDIGPQTTISIAMILHELTTNAIKHGALQEPGGRLNLDWETVDNTFVMRWREANGPTVTPSASRGFGSRLIDLGINGTGGVERRFASGGLEADFRIDLRSLAQ